MSGGRRPGRGRGRTERALPAPPVRTPSVTVVVTSYNYGRFLPDAAASALDQRDVDVRLVIVDDGSTDETPEVCAALAADGRVRVIRHPANRGHIAAVNTGFDAVTTPYLVKLDADDVLAPGALARATALLEARPEVGLVYGRPGHFTDAVPVPRSAFAADPAPARSWTVSDGHDWLARRCVRAVNVISSPEVVLRTDAVRRAGPRPDSLPHTYDLQLWLQIALDADIGRVNGPTQGYYRVHGDSQQRTVHAGLVFDLEGRRDAFTSVLATAEDRLPHAGVLLAGADRALAVEALDRACRAYDRGRPDDPSLDGLVAFALDTWPGARDLPRWRALERRRRLARRPPLLRPLVARAVLRRATEEVIRWRWVRTGEA